MRTVADYCLALGATTALRDTSTLPDLIKHNGLNDVARSFRAYEREMCAYASQAVVESAAGGKMFFQMRNFDELPLVS